MNVLSIFALENPALGPGFFASIKVMSISLTFSARSPQL